MRKPRPSVDLGYPTPARGRIPAFNTIEEEAEFWDTHSFTDFEEEWVPVEVRVGGALSSPLSVRLDQDDRQELDRRAREMGVGPSTLVRMWVKERLARTA
jgi:hypothetical protein